MSWQVPDEQIGRISGAIVLLETWMERVLARVHLEDEVERVRQERIQVEQRLRRLGQVYLDGLLQRGESQRQRRLLEDKLAGQIVPGVDAAQEARKLLENLPALWEDAALGERRLISMTMLDAVQEDTVEDRSIVAIQPKPAFRPLFEIATTRECRDVAFMKEPPEATNEPEAADPCSW